MLAKGAAALLPVPQASYGCPIAESVLLSNQADLPNAEHLRQTFYEWLVEDLIAVSRTHMGLMTDQERAAKTRELLAIQGYEPAG